MAKVWFTRCRAAVTGGALLVSGIGFTGCGGGPERPSVNAQYDAAKKEADPSIRARRLVGVALELSKAGDMNGANTAIAEALVAVNEIKEPASKAAGLNTVGDGMGRQGNKADAKKQLRAARNAADEVEEIASRVPLLSRTAEIWAQQLEDIEGATDILKEAEKLADQVEDPVAKVTAQLRVVSAFVATKGAGDVERLGAVAVENARGLADERKKAEALADAGGVMHRGGFAEMATALFTEAEAGAEKIADPSGRGYALLNLANRRLAAGAKDDAGKSLTAAEASAEKVSDRALREELTKKIRETRNKL